MSGEFPTGKLGRSISGGTTAFKIGGKVLKYLSGKPFRPEDRRESARSLLNKESAQILFKGLSALKGTALKIAQMLSLELDMLPSEVRHELEKSYNQAPPINRALVRKIIAANLGKPPEDAFRSFNTEAFAAASLGQVHRAFSLAGEPLAVKIQYPGIGATIGSDVAMVKAVLRPLPEYDLLCPVLDEIKLRLLEETDYEREAQNTRFFGERLNIANVEVPRVYAETSTDQIISLSYIEGLPLNEWLRLSPSQGDRDLVAQTLYDIFVYGLYELHAIHADPNPGNFIVGNDLNVGLVDFGCVKYLDDDFVHLYGQLPRAALKGSKREHMELLKAFRMGDPDRNAESLERLSELTYEMGRWFGKLYTEETFDFGTNAAFVREGKQLMRKHLDVRKSIQGINTNFVFLNRTRYGLVRLFQVMEARVRIRNSYECEGMD